MAQVLFDAIRTKAAVSITGSYTTLGTALTHNWRLFKITNNTNGDLLISLDGTTDNMFVPANSFVLYDLATNAPNVHNSDWFVMALNSQFYVKTSTAASTGAVWLEALYSAGV